MNEAQCLASEEQVFVLLSKKGMPNTPKKNAKEHSFLHKYLKA